MDKGKIEVNEIKSVTNNPLISQSEITSLRLWLNNLREVGLLP